MSRRKKTTPETALRVIRTWAQHQKQTGMLTLDPAHVIRLCDDALAAAKPAGGG